MSPTETVEAYYRALRAGDPLAPFFVEREGVVKFGVSERLAGYDRVAEGLREQTRTTEDWRVDSRRLQVTTRDDVAWFTDTVGLAWLDAEGTRRSFDTRWSGVLERVDSDRTDAGDREPDADETADSERASDGSDDDRPRWRFASMHVSAPHEL